VTVTGILLPKLLKLRGDEGAWRLLKLFPTVEVAASDPGICMDIETVADLGAGRDA
jgi:CTP:molybdopterin cytidylyltransferase MocA